MPRTTSDALRKIITPRVVSDVAPFINTASIFVENNLEDKGLSEEILTEIEKYLAAHFLALHPDERQLIEQQLGEAIDKYIGKYGEGFKATQFGQTAITLDSTGTLATLDAGASYTSLQAVIVDYGLV